MVLATLLLLEFNKIRFQSLVNRRIFSLNFRAGYFSLFEVRGDIENPIIERTLYVGPDDHMVKVIILKEVCDV